MIELKQVREVKVEKHHFIEHEAIMDGVVVGFSQLRLIPSHSPELPNNFANHIYYEIKPNFRESGYGIQILERVLEEAVKHNLSEVILTCNQDNKASQKIIEKNGGIKTDEFKLASGVIVYKYKIKL
jgi:predicted acetyltransferase